MTTKSTKTAGPLVSGHTPGPWHVAQGSDERDFIVAEKSGNTVCEPNVGCFDFTDMDPSVHSIILNEAKANARLIAAAPDLLAMVKRLQPLLHSYCVENEAVAAAERLIAKAEGRS